MDRDQVSDLYARYGPVIYGRCMKLLGNEDEARDALQEVFVRVLRSHTGFRGKSKPSTWIYRIATNLCLNRIRDRRPTRELVESDLPPARDAEAEVVWRDLARGLCRRADERSLTIALHTFVDGLTQEETAAVMGLSRRTVGKRLKALRVLSREVAAEEATP